MSNAIWKFEIGDAPGEHRVLSAAPIIKWLSVGIDSGKVVGWALVGVPLPKQRQWYEPVVIVWTGQRIATAPMEHFEFLGTARDDFTGLVHHVFVRLREQLVPHRDVLGAPRE